MCGSRGFPWLEWIGKYWCWTKLNRFLSGRTSQSLYLANVLCKFPQKSVDYVVFSIMSTMESVFPGWGSTERPEEKLFQGEAVLRREDRPLVW